MNNDWVELSVITPSKEGYYDVRFNDGTEDSKPFRIRPTKSIFGFMTDKPVTHWRNNTDVQDYKID